MDESSENGEFRQKMNLAKIMFKKYGVMHEIYQMQLQTYPVICCNITLGGMAELDIHNKTVTFGLATSRYSYLKDGVIKKRSKWSPLGYLKVSNSKYNKEKSLAASNLKMWCRELFWGDQTIVKVKFDE